MLELVERREGRVEVGDHRERRRVEHRVDELDVAARHRRLAERVAVGDDVGDGVAPRAGDVDDLVAAVEGAHGAPDEPAAEAERQHREQDRGRGRGRRPWSRSSAAPTTLSPNSSGCCSASEMTLIPPIEWPTTTHRPGDGVLDDAAQVVAELVDGAVLLVGAGRAAVAALVVEDGAHLAAVGGALEVPAVEVQRVAVHEDHGQVVVGGGHAAEVGRLVDLDVQVDARRRRRPRAARCGARRTPRRSPAARLPMTRFWRAMPTAPAAAARPAAPTTVPKMRPLMLNGVPSGRCPGQVSCRRGGGPAGRRPGSRSRS